MTGHVDGIGEIAQHLAQGDAHLIRFRFPRELGPLLALKGSVAVDGISLTVAELADELFGVAVILSTRYRDIAGLSDGARTSMVTRRAYLLKKRAP